jgi:hypothetical protein
LDISIDDGRVFQATETIEGVDGKTLTETIRAADDGKPYGVEGSPFPLTVMVDHAGDGPLVITMMAGRTRGRQVCRFGNDRNTTVCGETDFGADARREFHGRSVYVRE